MQRLGQTGVALFSFSFALAVGCGPRPSDGSDTSTQGTGQEDTGQEDTGQEDTGQEESESESGSDEGIGDDFPRNPDGDPCDVWTQDCPTAHKCAPASEEGTWDVSVCRPIDPNPKALGEACDAFDDAFDGYDDCQAEAYCFHVDPDTDMGVCTPLCTGSPGEPECPEDFECAQSGQGSLAICLASCTPLEDNCPEGQICFPNSGNGLFSCGLAAGDGDKAHGAPCGFPNECNPGHTCLSGELIPGCDSPGCCAEFCDLSEVEGCPDQGEGVSCTPWWEDDAPEGYENLGICVAP